MAESNLPSFAAALGRVPSGLFILTARSGDYETGMLASWVQQCSFEPPVVSVCVKAERDVNSWLMPDVSVVLNILGDSQTDKIAHFGRGFALDEPAFEGLSVRRDEGLPPILVDSLGFLVCRIRSSHDGGDHRVYFAEVVGGEMLGEGKPYVHVRKNGLSY